MNTKSLLLVQILISIIMIYIMIFDYAHIVRIHNFTTILGIILGIQWLAWLYTMNRSLKDKVKET